MKLKLKIFIFIGYIYILHTHTFFLTTTTSVIYKIIAKSLCIISLSQHFLMQGSLYCVFYK